MITSGLVITLGSDAMLAARAAAKLKARPEFTPGERNGRWLPVAMEARDDRESRDLHDWIHTLPAVEFVDVVYVNFDDSESSPAATTGVRRPSHPHAAPTESQRRLTSAAANKQGEP